MQKLENVYHLLDTINVRLSVQPLPLKEEWNNTMKRQGGCMVEGNQFVYWILGLSDMITTCCTLQLRSVNCLYYQYDIPLILKKRKMKHTMHTFKPIKMGKMRICTWQITL